MRPVAQTTFGTMKDGDEREAGNCFSACIASILELPVEAVPNFCQHKDWFSRCNQWLNERGYCYLEFGLGTEVQEWSSFTGYCVLVGDSPRGCKHAVVGHRAQMIHDPHPSGEGLLSIELIGYLIPLSPIFPMIRTEKSASTSRIEISSEQTVAEVGGYRLVLCSVRDIPSDKRGTMFSLRRQQGDYVFQNGDIEEREMARISGVEALLKVLVTERLTTLENMADKAKQLLSQ